jgi:hypothetical protein
MLCGPGHDDQGVGQCDGLAVGVSVRRAWSRLSPWFRFMRRLNAEMPSNVRSCQRCHRMRCIRLAPWPGCRAAHPRAQAPQATSQLPCSARGNWTPHVVPQGALWRFSGGCRPQAFHLSTRRDHGPGCQDARRYPQPRSSGGAVSHRLGAFIHVAIHKKPRVGCRFWLMQLPPDPRPGGLAR